MSKGNVRLLPHEKVREREREEEEAEKRSGAPATIRVARNKLNRAQDGNFLTFLGRNQYVFSVLPWVFSSKFNQVDRFFTFQLGLVCICSFLLLSTDISPDSSS